MTIEVEVLGEVYTTLKQYIASKDRQEATDNLMSILVDMLDDKDLKIFSGIDSYTKRSFDEYAGNYEEDDEDQNYEE
jgi:hypothetical protein